MRRSVDVRSRWQYNEEHGITPQTIQKAVRDLITHFQEGSNAGDADEKKIQSR